MNSAVQVHIKVNKPWGSYQDIFRSKEVVFKVITVDPGEEISYQTHEKRGEFWYIHSGVGRMILNGEDFRVSPGCDIIIDPEMDHQIVNNSDDTPIVIYEMQYGECDENDIVRLSDKYNRDLQEVKEPPKIAQYKILLDTNRYLLNNNNILAITLNKDLALSFNTSDEAEKLVEQIKLQHGNKYPNILIVE